MSQKKKCKKKTNLYLNGSQSSSKFCIMSSLRSTCLKYGGDTEHKIKFDNESDTMEPTFGCTYKLFNTSGEWFSVLN